MKNVDGACVLCGAPKAGVARCKCWIVEPQTKESQGRKQTGLLLDGRDVPIGWTTLPDTENMKAMKVCHPCRGKLKKVYIDGSATKAGASC
eukprot:710883-Heterocapsa_arctica.AAC.1